MREIHEAYSDQVRVIPGEIHSHAATFISQIPAGESIVAIENRGYSGESFWYVYDPLQLVKGPRFFKVADPDWNSGWKWLRA